MRTATIHPAAPAGSGRPTHRAPARRRRSARGLLEALEPRALFSSVPTGVISQFTRSQISGWAYNPDDGAAPVNIEITVNGAKTLLAADDLFTGIAVKVGSPYHGFTYSLPSDLPPGNSAVSIVAVSTTTGARKVLKTGTVTNPPPLGKVTALTATRITGWAYDPDSGSPIRVRVDVDGTTVYQAATDVPRPDLTKKYHVDNLGFDITGDFANHVVEVYAIDATSGQAKLLFTNNLPPKGKVEACDGFTVSGYAWDPNDPAAAVNIKVTIDGVTLSGTPRPANDTRADLTTLIGSANHGFTVTIPGLTPGKHTVRVYALDGQAGGAAPVLLGSKVISNAAPSGKVESITSTLIKGWAVDPDTKDAPATVKVYVDDNDPVTVTADQLTATAHLGSKNHGFSIDLTPFGGGSHAVTVTVVDNRTSNENEIVIYDNFINNHVPVGAFDLLTGTTLGGWAYDADAGGGPIEVDIYVDGVYTLTAVADQPRQDVDGNLPTPNHAFLVDLPELGFGTHRIAVYAAESQGNVAVLIGSKSVTNKRPVGAIEAVNGTTLTGWAADPDRLGESLLIKVYVNGALALTTTADDPRDDLAGTAPLSAVPGYTSYGYSISLAGVSGLASGANQVDVFAVDLNNGKISPLGSRVITV
jgi:hypothetical protein